MDIKVNSGTAIVLDLDDTLYNELEFLKSAYKEIATDLDTPNWTEVYATMLSLYRNGHNVFEYLTKNYAVSNSSLIESYRNHVPDIEPFPGVIDFLNQIKAKKGAIGLITDGRERTQNNKIKALGIEDYLDAVVISEQIGTEKPDQNNFTAIQKALNVNSYMYIADNLKKDFIAPNQLGWKSLALIDNGLNIHSNMYHYKAPTYRPESYFLSFTELRVL